MSEIHLLGMWTGRINNNSELTDGVSAHAVVAGQTGHVQDQNSSSLQQATTCNSANREQTKGFVLLPHICPQHKPSATQQTNT